MHLSEHLLLTSHFDVDLWPVEPHPLVGTLVTEASKVDLP